MSTTAYQTFSTKKTSQLEPIPGKKQVQNNAGGYVFELDLFKAVERFLILGSSGGTYYVGEKKLTKQNATRLIEALETDATKVIDLIVDISDRGRAPKNDPAIFALALAASVQNPDKTGLSSVEIRSYALGKLSKVCRIPTHLFHFVTYVKQFRGLGRGLKTSLANWYQSQEVEKLAYQVVKYQSRDGWSNADVLRISHPKTSDPARHGLYNWIVNGKQEGLFTQPLPVIVQAFEEAKGETNTKRLVTLIKEHNLSREMLPTEALTKPEVWEALLEKMPLTALLRNLGNMSKAGLLGPLSDSSKLAIKALQNQAAIKKARVHPVAFLTALKTYGQGHGLLGKGSWKVTSAIVEALDDAMYLAFDSLEPTGKRILFGVDVSGSMSWAAPSLNGITCAEGAAVMAMACARTETDYHIMGFASSFKDLGITAKMKLDQALAKTNAMNFGSTDCSLPMVWAQKNKVKVDAFVVITDSETWAGKTQPQQALALYRGWSGIQSKEIVIGMTATNFTIADPKDPLTLDIAGFDTSVPQVLQSFISD